MTEPSLDPEVIEQLRELADDDEPDFLQELLQGYLSTTESCLKAIGEALAADDPEQIERAAHAQKGASGNIGADNLAKLFLQLEEVGKQSSVEGAQEIVVRIADEFEQVKQEIKSLL